MDKAVIDAMIAFLNSRSDESFEALRQAYLRSSDYRPYDSRVESVYPLIDEQKFDQAFAQLQRMLPNLFLTPRARSLAAFLYEKLGREDAARREGIISQNLIVALSRTGDGTSERPYRVTRTEDEYDLLRYLGKEYVTQALVKDAMSSFDVLTCGDGTQVWFDVTPLIEHNERDKGRS
jgi:hypothetical protein